MAHGINKDGEIVNAKKRWHIVRRMSGDVRVEYRVRLDVGMKFDYSGAEKMAAESELRLLRMNKG